MTKYKIIIVNPLKDVEYFSFVLYLNVKGTPNISNFLKISFNDFILLLYIFIIKNYFY